MQVMQLMPTEFASAERADKEQLKHQAELLAASPMTRQTLDTVPKAVLVLNQHRQIVAANQTLEEMLGLESHDSVIGLRPGEALGCIHADRGGGGCGTSECCSFCGAGTAIVASLRGEREVRQCRIARDAGDGPLDLEISSTPVEIDGHFFIVLIAATS